VEIVVVEVVPNPVLAIAMEDALAIAITVVTMLACMGVLFIRGNSSFCGDD